MRRSRRPARIERILVRTPNWIGDAVFSIPAIRALARCFPESEITLFGPAGLCELLRGVDVVRGAVGLSARAAASPTRRLAEAWTLRARQPQLGLVLPESFSSALELRVSGASLRIGRSTQGRGFLLTERVPYGARPRTRHLVDEYLELSAAVGAVASEKTPRLGILPEAEREASDLLPDGSKTMRVGFVAGAAFGPAKRWPPDRFVELGRRFKGAEIVLFGSGQERFLAEFIASRLRSRTIVLAGRTSISVLAACVARCSLVVGNDTGPTHVAAAVGTPVVAIFGSTNPAWTGPRSELHRIVQEPLDCVPCHQRRCDRDYRCLRKVTVENVWQACCDLLGSRYRSSGRGVGMAAGGDG